MPDELTVIEQSELGQYEVVIERGIKTFVEVGQALMAIRENRLYRKEFSTFEDYCREKWGIAGRQSRLLMGAAEVVENIRAGSIDPVLPNLESHVRPLTKLDPTVQPIVWQRAVETAPNGKVTAAHVEAVVKEYKAPPIIEQAHPVEPAAEQKAAILETPTIAQNGLSIHFSSETAEHYTPNRIIDLVLQAMGGIDLDPCSNSKVKPNVPATMHYTASDDGLSKKWSGSVYMNPPYGREIGNWVEKLCNEFSKGDVTEAIALVPARVDTSWWDRLTSAERTYPLVCFVKGRLTFVNNEDPAPFPSALVYLGDNREKFYSVFSVVGRIWATWNDEIAGIVDYGSS